MNEIVFRGATPLQEFEVPFSLSHINKILITYRQNETNVMTYEITFSRAVPGRGFGVGVPMGQPRPEVKEDTPGVTSFSYVLPQKDTLKFLPNAICYVQLNVLLDDGTRVPSYEFTFRTGKQFYSEVVS